MHVCTLITHLATRFREAGVRNLKKQLEKIYRKVALKIFQSTGPLPTAPTTSTATVQGPDASTATQPATASTPSSDVDRIAIEGSSGETIGSGAAAEQAARTPGSTATTTAAGDDGTAAAPSRVVYTGDVIVVDKYGLKDYVGQVGDVSDAVGRV
jgi:Lon-like ATP-dependent protease